MESSSAIISNIPHQDNNEKEKDLLSNSTTDINTSDCEITHHVKTDVLVGSIYEAPEYLKDNEYIFQGYRVNCNTIKNVLKSLFMLHNESVNIWSHLLGTLFVIVLIVYTTIFIQSHHKQILSQMDISFNFTQINEDIKHVTGPFRDAFPDLENMTKIISEEYENSKSAINSIAYSIYAKTSQLFEAIDNKIGFVEGYLNCKECIEYIGTVIKNLKENVQEHLVNYTDHIVNNSYQLLENFTVANLLEDFNFKLEVMQDKLLDIMHDKHYKDFYPNSNWTKVPRWPLFIMLSSAIICLSCSAIFHWFSAHSKQMNEILSRLDYAGISILIAGSCYPPYFYFFFCEPFIRTAYLTFISVFAITVFLFSFKRDFHNPPQRKLRGVLFLTLGLSTSIPIIHLVLFYDSIAGFEHFPRLLFWYLGGISYVTGALIYINRIPERLRPGKHDIWGHSHQIFHFFVVFGVASHYMGCLDAYYYRTTYPCPA